MVVSLISLNSGQQRAFRKQGGDLATQYNKCQYDENDQYARKNKYQFSKLKKNQTLQLHVRVDNNELGFEVKKRKTFITMDGNMRSASRDMNSTN